MTTSGPIRVTVWSENCAWEESRAHRYADRPEYARAVRAAYPDGLHPVIATGLQHELGEGAIVRTAVLADAEHGLGDAVLEATDVLVWWGHEAHHEVSESVVDAVQRRVLSGMGLVALHSTLHAKIFLRLLGTSCNLAVGPGERQLVWTVNPTHPIAAGVPHPIEIPEDEVYGEFFDIPAPDELVFVSSYRGGSVFRSGCCFVRGNGRIFYFSPGHETYPIYRQPEVRRVIANAVAWAYSPAPSPVVPATTIPVPAEWLDGTS
jgi:trehalose utilization protein